jgi:hypothetical protein
LVDLNEAEEIIRQLKENDPATFERITDLRDGIRCGRKASQDGVIVLCRAGAYRQLYLADEEGEMVSRDVPAILGMLKCEPDTPAEPLPANYNQRVMAIQRRFAEEVQARRAEQTHAISLTVGQRYVLRELRLLLAEVEDADLQAQISLLEAAFRAPINEAVRGELNALRRNQVTGHDLLRVLDRIYHRHNLREANARRTAGETAEDLPLIVCSEALAAL